MSAINFLYWLKGYLSALEMSEQLPTKDHVMNIQTSLEWAIKAEQEKQKDYDAVSAHLLE